MRLLRSRLMRQPCSLCEVRSQYADTVRKTSESQKRAACALKTIADCSPIDNDVGMQAHPCVRCEKGKPVARRGRKA